MDLQDRRRLQRSAPVRSAPLIASVAGDLLALTSEPDRPYVINQTLPPTTQPPAAPQLRVETVQYVHAPL